MPVLRERILKVPQWFLAAPIRLLILPYIAGIIWHGLHPLASILTGDFSNARRWYIDESSLEPSYFQPQMTYDLILQTKHSGKYQEETQRYVDSLCQGIQVLDFDDGGKGRSRIPCLRHDMQNRSSFELVKITPHSAAIAPVGEAIVLVIPPIERFLFVKQLPHHGRASNSRKSHSQFQASVFQLIHRLAYQSPWLAKTILVVAPIYDTTLSPTNVQPNHASLNPVLDRAVVDFLDSYLGRSVEHHQRMPMEWTGAILRHVICLDFQTFESDNRPLPTSSMVVFEPQMGEVRILPQGRRGVLPNMDLVFLVRTVYERSTLLSTQPLTAYVKTKFQMNALTIHPYRDVVDKIMRQMKQQGLPKSLHEWAHNMLNLLAFEYVLALGPKPPHATALDYGIDSLTLQGSFLNAVDQDDYDEKKGNRPLSKQSPQEYPREYVQRMEFVLRSLSNLHEQLHHSTSLYLLTSPDRFVKHEEYLVPNLLLVIPLLIRAVLILSHGEDAGVDLSSGCLVLAATALWTWTCQKLLSGGPSDHPPPLGLLGVQIVVAVFMARLLKRRSLRTIQFVTCMAAAIFHVGLAFGHVALSFPSALFWTPVLAFPDMNPPKGGVSSLWKMSLASLLTLVALSCPFVGMVPHIFPEFTSYLRHAFVPLHFLFTLSCVVSLVGGNPKVTRCVPL
jgi:GPI-anchor transamidase subunit GAA1